MISAISYSQQSRQVTGVVRDSTGTPIPGVTFQVKGSKISGVTDQNGNFEFPDLKPGMYQLKADKELPFPVPAWVLPAMLVMGATVVTTVGISQAAASCASVTAPRSISYGWWNRRWRTGPPGSR